MSRDDEPTTPLPAADQPAAPAEPLAPTEPLAAAADRPDAVEHPTEPLVAPHVPVADVTTAQMSTFTSPEPARGSGAKRVAIVGLVSVAAAIIAVLAIGSLQRGQAPAPADTTAPPAAPSPSAPEAPVVDEPAPAPVDPAPVEPTSPPEPTTPPEPTIPPEPTPQPTT